MAPDFNAFIECLNEHRVEFLIVGGGIEREIEGVVVRILPLDRVIASKRATSRPKDTAGLPALEATLRAREGR